EGDLVVNGFAEFIRNLLVCKDEKAAALLEVVESFREKYIATAKNVSPAVLISSLNILNETEINYKAARNKRLHVELALIKLCYLQQAIELTAEGNTISKKKIIETAKPVALRHITPLEVKTRPLSGQKVKDKTNDDFDTKLIIDQPVVKKNNPVENTPGAEKPETGNREHATGNKQPATGKISALDKIRKQYEGNGSSANGNVNQPLQEDALHRAWIDYVQKLKDARNPAAQSFELASLRIKDENSFEAVTANNIEQKFIEQDRNKVFAYLQEKLDNRLLQFTVVIEENPDLRPKVEIPLSSKEQLQKMIEQYPLVKELKDKLKLDLDY
ncbi:MAG TPA: DNA polymerase III subunit gamma/tau, partial [Chitinophagaceae bacterium]|nr:DNA polymerase III subunit gamma/tau [Chitinophagaceae bacterium]